MTASVSTTSSSTAGISFDELCKGVQKNYSFNVVDLRKKTFQERKNLLATQIKKTIGALQLQSEKKVEEFIIGKTFAEARTGRKFDPTDVNTWRARGISKRWHGKYKTDDLKYDGLVVLGAVNRQMLTDTTFKDEFGAKRECSENWNQESYALALESALISHYAFEAFDPRLANDSFHTGNTQGANSAGYVIYLAFKYEETKDTESMT